MGRLSAIKVQLELELDTNMEPPSCNWVIPFWSLAPKRMFTSIWHLSNTSLTYGIISFHKNHPWINSNLIKKVHCE